MTSKLLAVVTLETNDVPNHIHIYEDDDIELLITAFCDINQIKEAGRQFIISEIKNHLQSIDRSTLDIMVQAEYQDQQSSNMDNKDQLTKNIRMCQQQNNNLFFNTNFTLNTIYNPDQLQINTIEDRQQLNTETNNQRKLKQQQYSSGNLNYNQMERKRGIAPNYRYGKLSQQTKERSERLVGKQNDYQYKIERKKIFDADQPKIKYKQDLEQIKNIFRQLDSDQDGQISSGAVNLRIGESTLQLIAPVLFHMQEQRMVLDFDSFVYLIISFNILIY